MTDEEITELYKATHGNKWDFARAIIAARDEELRKQEPVATVSIIDDDKLLSDIIDRELPTGTALYATPIPPTPSADTWSGIMEVCRVRGTYGRSDYITTGNRMDNRCNLRVTFDGSELIKAEVARPPNTPDGMRMFAVIDMSAPIPPRIKDFSELRDELDAAPIPPTHTPSQQEALDAINQLGGQDPMKAVQTLRDFILARPDTEGSGK